MSPLRGFYISGSPDYQGFTALATRRGPSGADLCSTPCLSSAATRYCPNRSPEPRDMICFVVTRDER
jgi:hypothetical protein